MGRKKIKLSLFTNDMTCSVENSKESTTKIETNKQLQEGYRVQQGWYTSQLLPYILAMTGIWNLKHNTVYKITKKIIHLSINLRKY